MVFFLSPSAFLCFLVVFFTFSSLVSSICFFFRRPAAFRQLFCVTFSGIFFGRRQRHFLSDNFFVFFSLISVNRFLMHEMKSNELDKRAFHLIKLINVQCELFIAFWIFHFRIPFISLIYSTQTIFHKMNEWRPTAQHYLCTMYFQLFTENANIFFDLDENEFRFADEGTYRSMVYQRKVNSSLALWWCMSVWLSLQLRERSFSFVYSLWLKQKNILSSRCNQSKRKKVRRKNIWSYRVCPTVRKLRMSSHRRWYLSAIFISHLFDDFFLSFF